MTSPGGPEVGRVSVRVVPDTSKFDDELRRKLRGVDKKKANELRLPVRFDVDNDQLKTELESIRVSAIAVPVEPNITGFRRELNTRLKEVKPNAVKVPTEPDLARFRSSLNSQLRTVKPPAVKVPAEPDLTGFRSALNNELRAVRPTPVKVGAEPDLTGFRAALATQLSTVNNSVRVPVELEPNITAFRQRLRAVTGTVRVDLEPNLAAFRTRLRGLNGATVRVDLEPNITAFRARLRALNGATVRVDLVPNITNFRAQLRALSNQRVQVNVDVDEVAIAARVAAAIRAGAAAGGGIGGGIGGVGALGAGFTRLIPIVAQLVALIALATAGAFALVVAGAAVAAAWGAVSTAIAVLPALILGLIGPIAAIAVGMDGIKEAAKTLKPELDAVKKAVDDTFKRGFTEAFNTIRPIFPVIQGGMVGLANAINVVVGNLAKFVLEAGKVKVAGTEISLLETVFNRIQGAIIALSPAINDLVYSFLLVASQKQLWDSLTGAILRFGNSFKTMVQDRIADGTLQRAMEGLGVVLGALGDAFIGLVSNGIQLFANAWPGVAKFLDDLTYFFGQFDWQAIGKDISGIFAGLGESLRKVKPETVDKIEDAIHRIAELFQDPAFQQGIADFIDQIPFLIDLIGGLAKGFSDFGASLKTAREEFDILANLFGDPLGNWKKDWEEAGKFLEQASKDLLDWIDQFTGPAFLKEGSIEVGIPDLDSLFDDFKIPELEDDLDTLFDDLETVVDEGGGRLADAMTVAMEKLASAAIAGMAATQAAIQSGTTGWALAVGVGMQQVMLRFGQSFAQMATIATAGMIRVQTAMTQGTTGWALAVGVAMQSVLLEYQTGMDQAAAIVDLGMLTIQNLITVGTIGWATAIALAMEQCQLAVQTGFDIMTAIASLGMLTIQNLITVGTLGWSTAIALAMEQMVAVLTAGFEQMRAIVTAGMIAIGAVIAAALSLIVQNVTNVMLLIQTIVRDGFAVLLVIVTEAMNQLLELFGRWAEIVLVITNAITQIIDAVRLFIDTLNIIAQVGMDLLRTTFESIWQAIVDYFSSSIAEMERLWTGLWDFLTSAASTGMSGVVTAVSSGMADATAAVRNGVNQMVSTLNSAVGQFRSAGSNMGAALAAGLRSQLGAVRAAAAELANAAAAATRRASVQASPSKVFIALGENMGLGLAIGMEDMTNRVARAANALVDAATPTDLDTIGQTWTGEFQPIIDDIQSQLRNVGTTPAALVAGASGGGVEIVQNFNVPSAEEASDKALHGMRRLSAMGMFA